MPDKAPPPKPAAPIDIKAVFDLKPVDAIAFLEAKLPKTTVAWSEMMHEEHAAGFTVAKVAKLDLLADIQASLVKAQDEGMPFAQWQAEIEPTLVNAGWMGLVTDEKLTGTEKPVFIGPRRLRTIYDTNLRMSRAKGQWDRIQKVKAKRPFLQYSAVMDSRTRPQHAAWHGTILPVDHPFWLTHFPPCGWHCRCTAQQLSQRDLDHRGWKVTPDAKVPDLTATVPFYRKGSSVPMFVPRGVDPGFAYNPGISRLAAASDKAAASVESVAVWSPELARSTVDELVQSPEFETMIGDRAATIPVMVLDPDLQLALRSSTPVVRLSPDTLGKQATGHPDLTIADYRQLPAMGAGPDLVLAQGDQRLMLLRAGPDRWLKAVIKRTQDGTENYVVSFQLARDKEVRRLRRQLPEVKLGQ